MFKNRSQSLMDENLSAEYNASHAPPVMLLSKCLVNGALHNHLCFNKSFCHTRTLKSFVDGIDVGHLLVKCAKNRDNVPKQFRIIRLKLHNRLISGHIANEKGEWDILLAHGLH